jgi:hypothetical protein
MRTTRLTTLAGFGVLAGATLGLAACNHTPVPPARAIAPPPPPVVQAVPSLVHRDPQTGDEIKVTKGLEGTQIRNTNGRTGSSVVVTGDLGGREQVEMYSDNQRSGQQILVRPGWRGDGVQVSGVDLQSGRYWDVIDPEGQDGPNFIAADPKNGNIYSVTTEPDGSSDKSRQNDFLAPGDVAIRSRIEAARTGLPKKDPRQ